MYLLDFLLCFFRLDEYPRLLSDVNRRSTLQQLPKNDKLQQTNTTNNLLMKKSSAINSKIVDNNNNMHSHQMDTYEPSLRSVSASSSTDRSNGGALALHYASARGCLDCVQLLVAASPDIW